MPAVHVATDGAKGKNAFAREEVVQWFFFNGVGCNGRQPSVGIADQFSISEASDLADSLFSFLNNTFMGTKRAFCLVPRNPDVETGFVHTQ